MYTWGYIKDACLAKLDLDEAEAINQSVFSRLPFYANEVITQICSAIKPKRAFYTFTLESAAIVTMPDDFVSFCNDTCSFVDEDGYTVDADSSQFKYHGYNQIMCYYPTTYTIAYNARWIVFTKDMDNNVVLEVPADILDCIPSYVAHQCYKIEDDEKSSIFRNEYELFLGRIDNVDYSSGGSIIIGGDW